MKVVLDEGVPEGLADFLPGHDVHTVSSLGAKGTKNGKLLKLLETDLAQAFITADKSIDKQQNLLGRPFASLILSTNYWPAMEPHTHLIAAAVDSAEPGSITKVECGRFVPRRFRHPTV